MPLSQLSIDTITGGVAICSPSLLDEVVWVHPTRVSHVSASITLCSPHMALTTDASVTVAVNMRVALLPWWPT